MDMMPISVRRFSIQTFAPPIVHGLASGSVQRMPSVPQWALMNNFATAAVAVGQPARPNSSNPWIVGWDSMIWLPSFMIYVPMLWKYIRPQGA
jgi:hypothetical protein